MCEERPATKVYGFPVCEQCYDGLVSLDSELKEMEEQDPELKAIGERAEQALRDYLATQPGESENDE